MIPRDDRCSCGDPYCPNCGYPDMMIDKIGKIYIMNVSFGEAILITNQKREEDGVWYENHYIRTDYEYKKERIGKSGWMSKHLLDLHWHEEGEWHDTTLRGYKV